VKKNGFTIIEWLVSFFLFLLVTTFAFQIVTRVHANLYRYGKRSHYAAQLYAALDVLRRKVYQAPSEKSKWKKISDSELIWYDERENLDVGWFVEKEQFFMATGLYEQDRWKKRRRNLIAKNIRTIKFDNHANENNIKSIRILLEGECEGKKYNFERIMALRNRIV